jgi:hypothetical protein
LRFRIKAAGVVVAALGVVGLAAMPAGAAGGKVAVFTGFTTSLSPPVQQVGGSGSYAFQSSKCEEAAPAKACSISSSGTYTNIVCGTGSASGTATLSPDGKTFSYHITLVAGLGVLTGGATGLVDIVPTGLGKGKACVTHFTIAAIADP